MSRKLDKKDFLIAAALLAAYFAVLLATSNAVGFVRDEGYYFKAAQEYNAWFVELWENTLKGAPLETFKRDTIDRCFSYNHEHPALMKELFGFSWQIFHNKLDVMRNSTAFRLPGMFMGALMLALVYLFAAQARSRRAGLYAALAMATIPRWFFHAHLAAFDVPITAMIFLTVYAYWRSETSSRWGWMTGVIFGLALATKHTAWFVPGAVFACWMYRYWGEFRVNRSGGASFGIPPIPLAFITMIVIGPLIMIGHWPYLWPALGERLGSWFNFHLQHEHYPVSYFNEVYDRPPFPRMFVPVMTAITVPLATLLMMSFGFFRGWYDLVKGWLVRRSGGDDGTTVEERSLLFLLVFNALFWFLPWLVSNKTPIFGGVKHWFPAMPFLAVLAGLEFDRLLCTLAGTGRRVFVSRVFPWLAGALLILPAVQGNIYIHPYGTGFYNEIEHGTRGAADDEMQRKFWGYASIGVLDWLNKNAEQYSRVAFHRTNWDSYQMYIRDGMLRSDIRYANDVDDADYLVFHYQKGFLETEYKAFEKFGSAAAWTGVYVDEAPFVQVFKRVRR
jgi:4-amino-4-deoxy-L-arabinose transferase-like glycosyltransferase